MLLLPTPEPLSVRVMTGVTLALYTPALVTPLMAITGLVRSTFTGPAVLLLLFPALSLMPPVLVSPLPSGKVKVAGHGAASPDGVLPSASVGSLQLQLAVGAPVARLYHPVDAGAGLTLLLMTGLVVSTRIGPKLVLALFPAMSLTLPLAVFVPSLKVWSAGQAPVAMPLVAS